MVALICSSSLYAGIITLIILTKIQWTATALLPELTDIDDGDDLNRAKEQLQSTEFL